jgi:hypothetical protein
MKLSFRSVGALILWLFMLSICSYGFVAWQILQYGNQVAEVSADAAIVLGAAAWGSKPSPDRAVQSGEGPLDHPYRRIDSSRISVGSPGGPSILRLKRGAHRGNPDGRDVAYHLAKS